VIVQCLLLQSELVVPCVTRLILRLQSLAGAVGIGVSSLSQAVAPDVELLTGWCCHQRSSTCTLAGRSTSLSYMSHVDAFITGGGGGGGDFQPVFVRRCVSAVARILVRRRRVQSADCRRGSAAVPWPAVFGSAFDQPIDTIVLPPSARHLTFGARFNQRLDGVLLQPMLTHLDFGGFDLDLSRVALPSSITHLWFGDAYGHS
jgi:hypothetical protein